MEEVKEFTNQHASLRVAVLEALPVMRGLLGGVAEMYQFYRAVYESHRFSSLRVNVRSLVSYVALAGYLGCEEAAEEIRTCQRVFGDIMYSMTTFFPRNEITITEERILACTINVHVFVGKCKDAAADLGMTHLFDP